MENLRLLENSGHKLHFVKDLLHNMSGGATPLGAAYPDSGIPFLRVQNIMEGYLNLNDIVYVSEETHRKELKRSSLQPHDVLLTITGVSYGKSAYVPPNFGDANINQHSVRMAFHPSLLPEYVSMFLNSRFGKLQSDMKITGITRPALDYEEIKTILIPVLPDKFQKEIRSLVKQSEHLRFLAQSLYMEAESLLLHELGFDPLEAEQEISYVGSLSEAISAQRLDAEYFHPKYEALLSHIQNTGQGIRLGDWIKEPIRRGIQPNYVESGDLVVINSQHVGKTHIELADNRRTTKGKAVRGIVKPYDVLLNSTGYITIGRCQPLLDDVEAVVDGHISIIRPKDGLDPVYLALFLNSKLGQMQTERHWTGSSGQIELRTDSIQNYLIWCPDMNLQKHISQLIEKAHSSRKEAISLLEQAKKQVEDMILGG